MISRRVDGARPISGWWETVGNLSSNLAVYSSPVNSLEKRKDPGVRGSGLLQGCKRLNDDVSVTDDQSLIVKGLRSSKVGLLSVGEGAKLDVLDIESNGERGVGSDSAKVFRESKFNRRHVVGVGKETLRDRIARASLDLLSIGNRYIARQANVDEVVCRRQGRGLSLNWWVLPVLGKVGANDPWIERQGRLRVSSSVSSSIVIPPLALISALVTTLVAALSLRLSRDEER